MRLSHTTGSEVTRIYIMSTQIQILRFQDLFDRDKYYVFNRVAVENDVTNDTLTTIHPSQAKSHYIFQHDRDSTESPESLPSLPYPGRLNWPGLLKYAYPGILTSHLSSHGHQQSLDVICKVVSMSYNNNRIAHELFFYKKLEDLQGRKIPECFGMFEGQINGERVECLVLEYCGEPVEDFRTTSWEFREELVDIVHELHAQNIHHGGLYKENILYRQRLEPDGATASIEAPLSGKHIEPVLINFGNASLGFQCDAMKTNQRIQLRVEEPQAKDLIGCQQLLRFARSISAWYPSTFKLQKCSVPIELRDSPIEKLIDAVKERRYYSDEEIRALDVNVIEKERRQALERYDKWIRTWKACEKYSDGSQASTL